MLVVEVLGLLVVAIVLVVTVKAVGAPAAEILASKTRYKYDALGSEAEVKLKKRLESLEEEVRQLHKQLGEVKDTSEFAVRLLEEAGHDTSRTISTSSTDGETLKLDDVKKKKTS